MKRRVPQRYARRQTAGAVTLLCTVGCGQVLGLDDYEVPRAGESDATPIDAVELPILPARPADNVEACEDCVEDKCDDLRRVCLASQPCRDMLACVGGNECADPNCIAQCTDSLPYSAYFWSYFDCAFKPNELGGFHSPTQSRCFQECGAGSNWGCLRNFHWDPESSETPEVTAQLIGILGFVGAPGGATGFEVAACTDTLVGTNPPGDTGCGMFHPVGVNGEAQFEFTGTFRGDAFAVRKDGTGHRERIYYFRPIVRSGTLPLPLAAGTDGVALFVKNAQPPQEASLGVIAAFQLDCLGVSAPAYIALTDPAPGSSQRCIAGIGNPTDCTTPENNALMTNVPVGWGVGVESSLPDGRVVSRRSVLAASYWTTTVYLAPMDASGR